MSQSEAADEWKWNKLEWIAAQSASSRSIMIFKPNRSLFTYQMPTSESPLSIQGGTPPITLLDSTSSLHLNFLLSFFRQNRSKLVLHWKIRSNHQLHSTISIYSGPLPTQVGTHLQIRIYSRMKLVPKIEIVFTILLHPHSSNKSN